MNFSPNRLRGRLAFSDGRQGHSESGVRSDIMKLLHGTRSEERHEGSERINPKNDGTVYLSANDNPFRCRGRSFSNLMAGWRVFNILNTHSPTNIAQTYDFYSFHTSQSSVSSSMGMAKAHSKPASCEREYLVRGVDMAVFQSSQWTPQDAGGGSGG